MELTTTPKRPTVIKFGLITSAMLIFYFLILAVTGMMKFPGLRMVNYLLIAISLYFALKEIRHKNHPHIVTYLGGLGMGFMIILIASIIFSFFVMAYGMLVNQNFINAVWANPFYDNHAANAMAMAAYIFSETLFLGVILDLIVITFLKRNDPAVEDQSE